MPPKSKSSKPAASSSANLVELPAIPRPNDEAQTQATTALEQAKAFKIVNNDGRDVACSRMLATKTAWQTLEDERAKLKAPILVAGKTIDNFFRGALTALANAERLYKDEIARYDTEVEEKARAEQARLEEQARVERERIEAAAREAERKAAEKAEAASREAEAQRLAEENARNEAAQARARGDTQAAQEAERHAREAAKAADKTERRAERVASAGQAKADELQRHAQTVVAPVLRSEPPKFHGVSTSQVWDFEITDPSKINPAFLMPDVEKIRRQVTALKKDAGPLIGEGIRIFPKKQVSGRTQ